MCVWGRVWSPEDHLLGTIEGPECFHPLEGLAAAFLSLYLGLLKDISQSLTPLTTSSPWAMLLEAVSIGTG